MLIRIRDQRMRLCLPIPNALLFSRPAAGWLAVLLTRLLQQNGSEIQIAPEQARQLAAALRRWRRHTPDRTLVEVASADGSCIQIRL